MQVVVEMAIKMEASERDLETMRDKRKEYEDGYEDDGDGDGGDDDMSYDDDDSAFDSDFDSGSSSYGEDSYDSDNYGSDSYGSDSYGDYGDKPKEKKPDPIDQAMNSAIEGTIKAFGAFGRVMIDTVKSFKNRTANDIGLLSKDTMKVGILLFFVGFLIGTIGTFAGSSGMGLTGVPAQIILAGIIVIGSSIIGLTFPAYLIQTGRGRNYSSSSEDESEECEEEENDYEDNEDVQFEDDECTEEEPEEEEEETIESLSDMLEDVPEYEPEEHLNEIPANIGVCTRALLVELMGAYLPKNTPSFAKRVEIKEDDPKFETLDVLVMKAVASAAGVDFEDLDTSKYRLCRAYDTLFTYELYVRRYKKLNNLTKLEEEVVSYFRDGAEDATVTATAVLDGDYYKIMVSKGEQHTVTLGDILGDEKIKEFYKSDKNALPACIGLTILGVPITRDCKMYDTMLIAGKPRSGKSWFTFSILLQMMMFNTPEDLQVIIIDPKKSPLLNMLGLLPHVCGVHTEEKILRILDDLINKEGERRARLMADNKCNTLWDLRKRGIKLPVIYIFIDEFMTIVNGICKDKENKEQLDNYLNILISKLPYTGIRLMFVPHRAAGVVNKTQRTMIQFNAAVRAENEVILETLGIKKFNTPLVMPGDTAIKMSGDPKEMFVKGTAIGRTDDENSRICINVAKAFYKMGLDIPDMRSIGYGFNRDERAVKEELGLE